MSDASPRPIWRTAVQPRWLGLLTLALAIAAVMTAMGVWQLGVYKSKTAEATAERAAAPPVPLRSLFSIDEGLPAKAVGLMAMPFLRRLRGDLTPSQHNGASFLGLQGIVVKSHGSAKEEGIQSALRRALLEVRENLPQRLHGRLEHLL